MSYNGNGPSDSDFGAAMYENGQIDGSQGIEPQHENDPDYMRAYDLAAGILHGSE